MQMLGGSSDPEVAERAITALEEVNKAAKQSTYELRLQKMLDFVPSGSEAGSILETSHTKRTEGMGTDGLRRIPSAPPPPKRRGEGNRRRQGAQWVS
jgi:hypothetical protein